MTEPQQSALTSTRFKAANGYRAYGIGKPNSLFVIQAGVILRDRFGFGPIFAPAVGLDAVVIECTKGDVKLMLGWDIWTGFSVVADSPAGELIVDQFGDYVDSISNDVTMDEYRDE